MKFNLLVTSIIMIITGWEMPVWGQCVQADTSVQYSIGSSKKPTDRRNDVQMESDPKCSGNVSVTKGVQGYQGDGENRQQYRRVKHKQTGGRGNPTGIDSNTVQIRSGVEQDLYLPSIKK